MASSLTPPPSSDIDSSWPLVKDGSSKVKHFSIFKKPSSEFVGRIKLLSKIHTQLMICSSKSKWWERMVIIYGPSGIGKSEVARMYAHLFLINPSIQNIAWIDSGNLASLKKSFSSLAKYLGIEIQGKEVERVVEMIYTYFSDHIGTGLFIFDNAKQMRGTHMEIFKFLPRHYMARPPLILITSRSDKWELRKEYMICMEGLNDKEAVTFLCNRLNVSEDQENYEEMLTSFEKLAKALHGFPLALALTASKIEDKTSSEIDDIAARFMTNAPHSNKNNVNLCIDVVQEALGDAESNSRKLLNILAYLPSDDISVEKVEGIFKYIFKKASRPEDFTELEKCSLIAIQNHGLDPNGEKYQPTQVSEQVQKWARKRLHTMKEAPIYYLTQICDYYCHTEDFTDLEVATTCLHSRLRKLNWSGDSVKYSILFAAKLVSKIELTSAHGSAWEMVRDVYKFRTDTPIANLPPVGGDVMKLLHLCQYFFNETSIHDELLLLNKTGMGMGELEKKWLESVEFYIEHNFSSVTVQDGKCELRFIETLQDQITQKLIMKKRHHRMIVQKAIRNLLLYSMPLEIMELEATLTYYKLLWKYCRHSECIKDLVLKLSTLHYQHYENTYPKLSKDEKALYWENGPFSNYKLVNLFLNTSEESDEFEWSSQLKSLFLVSFFAEENCKILAQHLEYLSKLDFMPPEAEVLLQFVTCLAMDTNQSCADDLAKNVDFTHHLSELTHAKLALDNAQNITFVFWCNLLWLAIYARSENFQRLVFWAIFAQYSPLESSILHFAESPFKIRRIMSTFSPSVISQLHDVFKLNKNTMGKAVTKLAINVLDLWKDKFKSDGKLKLWNPKQAVDDFSLYDPVPEMLTVTSNKALMQDNMLPLYHDFAHARYKEEMEVLTASSAYSIDARILQEYHESSASKAIKHISEAVQLTQEQINNVQHLLRQSFDNYQNITLNIQEKTGPPIGIDIGTTYCCMAVVRSVTNSPEAIKDHIGLSKISSYVSFPFCDEDDNEITFGEFAKRIAWDNPKGKIFDFKRMIGRDFDDPRIQHDKQFWPFDIIEGRGGIKVMTGPKTSQYPSEIMAELIKRLKQIAEDYLGYRVTSAVIAIPVYFSQHQTELLTQACEQVGLQILQLVTQPTAAAVAYSLPKISKHSKYSKNGLIFDLGGGTLDLAFFEVTEGQVHVKAIGGDDHLGGRDIDNNLVQYCIQQFYIKHGINLNKNETVINPTETLMISKRLQRLQRECERQKLLLSRATRMIIIVDRIYNDLDMCITVTRETFNEINMGLFERCIEVLGIFLENNSISRDCIDDVVIIGGSSRIPRIQNMLIDFFEGKPLCTKMDPEEAVALGASSLAFGAHNVGVSNILFQDCVSILPPIVWKSSCKIQKQGSRGSRSFGPIPTYNQVKDDKPRKKCGVHIAPVSIPHIFVPQAHLQSASLIRAQSFIHPSANIYKSMLNEELPQLIPVLQTDNEHNQFWPRRLSEYEKPIQVKPMIQFACAKKPDIGIYITSNTFQISSRKELVSQSFTELVDITPEMYFADDVIIIGARAHPFSSFSFRYMKDRFFNIFELINSAEIKTHRLDIQGTIFTLCTTHIIAAFFHKVFNQLNIGGDGKIIVTLPFSKTYCGVKKIRKSLNILGYFNIRILPSFVTTAIASLDTLGYYKNVEIEAPFRKYIFVLDIQIDSFSMTILQMLPKQISVISSRCSESFAACQAKGFAGCHADWYKGVEIPQGWKDYIQIVYELRIDPFCDISLQAYATIEAVVINESKASSSFLKMVKEVLHVKFAKLQVPQIEASSLLGASLLAAPLSGVKSLGEVRILDPHMQVDATGLISKSLVLTTNIEGQEVIIENFTRQKFQISTDVTPTSKEKMEPKHLYVLIQNKSNRIDGEIVTSDAGYYQCRVEKNRAKRQLPVSKLIEFEIISKEDLDGFFSLNVVNKSNPDFEILLTKKENLVCNSVCVSPAFLEFGRLIAFYERREAKTIREQFSSETKTDLAKIETKTTINPVLPTMHGAGGSGSVRRLTVAGENQRVAGNDLVGVKGASPTDGSTFIPFNDMTVQGSGNWVAGRNYIQGSGQN